MSAVTQGQQSARSSIVNDPKFRSLALQLLLVRAIGWFVWVIARNTQINLQNRNIASGFQFLWSTAGFGVNQALISYTEASSYGRALVVGVLKPLPAPARAPQIGLPWPGGGLIIMAAVLGGGAWLLRNLYLRTQSVAMR